MKKTIHLVIMIYFCAACSPQATAVIEATSTPQTMEVVVESTTTATLVPPTAPSTVTPIPPLRISPADGMTQLLVPAGTVNMGALDVFAENDEKPARAVQVNAFWIDQVEVTNGMYSLCVQTGVCRRPAKANSNHRLEYFGNSEYVDYPVIYVTWLDAQTYCEWAGRRLPSETEWERAARGDDMRTFPWGDEPPNRSLANSNNESGDTGRVGSFAAGASPFGALDMAGNVWEWVADQYAPNSYPPYNRVIRGGSYQDAMLDLRVSNRGYEMGPDPAAVAGTEAYTGRSSEKIGFRCAEDD